MLRETGEFVGNLTINVDSQKNRNGTLGITLVREHWGKGYGEEVLRTVLDHCFKACAFDDVTSLVPMTCQLVCSVVVSWLLSSRCCSLTVLLFVQFVLLVVQFVQFVLLVVLVVLCRVEFVECA